MNFPIIMFLQPMWQGLADDTDKDMMNASALESAVFALCCIVTAARKVIVQRALFLLSAIAALVCITASDSKESNKTEPDTLTFQAGAPIIISSEGAYSVIECSDGEIIIRKVPD